MIKAILLEPPFERALGKDGREGLAAISGHPMTRYVKAALEEAGIEVTEPGSAASDDVLLFVSGDAPTVSPADLQLLIEAEGRRAALTDGADNPIAIRIARDELPAGFQDSAHTIDELYRQLEDLEIVRSEQEDSYRVLDFWDLNRAAKTIGRAECERRMRGGIRIDFPELVEIDLDAVIGEGTRIIGPCRICGMTVIGKDCLIESGSVIVDSTIGDGVRVTSSLIEQSVMEDGSNIGPYSHLRPKAHLGRKVHIGNFVEVKNATLGEGTKAGHLAYVGDADVGSGVNIGCGVIFVNYDGAFKHRSVVGDGAFLGSNANLVAPVHIGDEGFVAAGSTITKDVEAGALAVERAEQVSKAGYTEMKKRRDEERRNRSK